MLHAGTIVGVYGVRGWVRIRSFTEPQENLLAYERWFLDRHGTRAPTELVEGRRHGRGLIARIAGVDTRDKAEALRGVKIRVPANVLPALPEEEFYWHQLVGLQVWGGQEQGQRQEAPRDERREDCPADSPGKGREEGREKGSEETKQLYGRVAHLLETGANDVLVVEPCEGSIDERERLIPYLFGDVVQKVDLSAGRIDVAWHPED